MGWLVGVCDDVVAAAGALIVEDGMVGIRDLVDAVWLMGVTVDSMLVLVVTALDIAGMSMYGMVCCW